jgi:CPA2 family monovalent cation:H+ antiporter-2
MEATALTVAEIGGILLAAAIAGYVARRAGLPATVGYLLVGVLVSPFTPGYVADRHQVQLFADIGVVFLLFEVGLEVDLRTLARESRRLLVAVPTQVMVTGAAGLAAFLLRGMSFGGAAILALAIALSSSVVIVNISRGLKRKGSPRTGEVLLGWSVVQDLAGTAVALVVIASLGLGEGSVWLTLLRIGGFLVIAVLFARLLPLLLRGLRHEGDLFLLVSVSGSLLIAGIGAEVFSVPLALAAFVGGLAVAESREAAQARERLMPFRELFAVLFFVAVGTLFDPGSLGESWAWALLVVGLVLLAKVAPSYVLGGFLRDRSVDRWQLAFGLGQIGEFSFVLASIGVANGLVSSAAYAGVLAGVVVTIPLSSVLVRVVGRTAPVPL